MEVTQTTTAAAQTTAPAVASSTSAISSDFETFLRMLTVQMQNQDPLNPVDSSGLCSSIGDIFRGRAGGSDK